MKQNDNFYIRNNKGIWELVTMYSRKVVQRFASREECLAFLKTKNTRWALHSWQFLNSPVSLGKAIQYD